MTRVEINEAGFDALLAGDVADDLAERGERVRADQHGRIHHISGELGDSLEVTPVRIEGDDAVTEVGSSLYYAGFVNDGTVHADPHPFVEPSAEAAG